MVVCGLAAEASWTLKDALDHNANQHGVIARISLHVLHY